MAEKTASQEKGFDLALGLVDFLNPLTYSINTILIWNGMKGMNAWTSPLQKTVYLIGIILSLVIGLIIPTGKLLVGLGKIEFHLPVGLLLACNLGIFLTGAALLSVVSKGVTFYVILGILVALITAAGVASKKLNTSVMLLGLFGYTMIYVCMAIYAVTSGAWVSMVLFVLACLAMYGTIVFSMKADLTNPKNHWPIEGLNISCQILFGIGLFLLFK